MLPSPTMPLLSTVRSPPIAWARRRLMASPRPVPPYRRVTLTSSWLNDWKSRSRRSGAMPMPVSRTTTVSSHVGRFAPFFDCSDAGRAPTWTWISPRSVNFTEFERRLRTTWRTRPTSPTTVAGTSSSTS